MAKKWIGVGVLSHKGKDIAHGEDIPENFPEDALERLINEGQIGEIIEPVKPEPAKKGKKDDGK